MYPADGWTYPPQRGQNQCFFSSLCALTWKISYVKIYQIAYPWFPQRGSQDHSSLLTPNSTLIKAMQTMKKVWTYLVIAMVALVASVNYELFIFPNQFAPSGVNGICTMIQYLYSAIACDRFHMIQILAVRFRLMNIKCRQSYQRNTWLRFRIPSHCRLGQYTTE